MLDEHVGRRRGVATRRTAGRTTSLRGAQSTALRGPTAARRRRRRGSTSRSRGVDSTKNRRSREAVGRGPFPDRRRRARHRLPDRSAGRADEHERRRARRRRHPRPGVVQQVRTLVAREDTRRTARAADPAAAPARARSAARSSALAGLESFDVDRVADLAQARAPEGRRRDRHATAGLTLRYRSALRYAQYASRPGACAAAGSSWTPVCSVRTNRFPSRRLSATSRIALREKPWRLTMSNRARRGGRTPARAAAPPSAARRALPDVDVDAPNRHAVFGRLRRQRRIGGRGQHGEVRVGRARGRRRAPAGRRRSSRESTRP